MRLPVRAGGRVLVRWVYGAELRVSCAEPLAATLALARHLQLASLEDQMRAAARLTAWSWGGLIAAGDRGLLRLVAPRLGPPPEGIAVDVVVAAARHGLVEDLVFRRALWSVPAVAAGGLRAATERWILAIPPPVRESVLPRARVAVHSNSSLREAHHCSPRAETSIKL